MARITSYNVDNTPDESDLLLGNAPGGETKTLRLGDVADWLNENGLIKVLGQLSYVYNSNTAWEPQSLFPTTLTNIDKALNTLTEIVISKTAIGGYDATLYLDTLLNRRIILGNLSDPSNAAVFTVTALTDHGTDDAFYIASLTYVSGSGFLIDGQLYGVTAEGLQSEGVGVQQTYPIESENGSIFEIVVSNEGDLIVVPEGSTEPEFTSPPVITGTEKVWYTLGAIAGGVTGSPSPLRTWQWQRSDTGLNWTNIEGATAATYTLVAADAGKYIRVQQTETNVLDSVTNSSAATGQIQASVFADTLYAQIQPVTWGQLTVQTWD